MDIGIEILIGVGAFNAVVIVAMIICWVWVTRQDAKMVRDAMPDLHEEIKTELAQHPGEQPDVTSRLHER